MYKIQVVLVPPSVRDNFVPIGFTSTLEDSSHLLNTTGNQNNVPNTLENSIQNWNNTNNSLILSNYFTQPRLKRFLLFTNPSNTLLDLADEILIKCEKIYPNLANDIEILTLQDSNSCDLDPDFIVKDVFNIDNTVRVILKNEINLDSNTTQHVSLYGNAKRRKLNNFESQSVQQQQQQQQQQIYSVSSGTLKVAKKRSNGNSKTITNPNLRISTPLANQIFPSQTSNNSDDEDNFADRSFLPPPTQPQSPPIRISSGIENSKRMKYSAMEDTVSRSETVDPDKSKQQRLLSGTPFRTDLTPNRVTLTGQRVVSESYDGTPRSNGLIFTSTTQPLSGTRRGSMNNSRITSGMLTIPEPRIAEVEKELKEGPSSPASVLPLKADRIPMKKPYMEQHPVISGEDSSSSSSETYEAELNKGEQSPSLRKSDISNHNESQELPYPVKNSPFNPTGSSQNNYTNNIRNDNENINNLQNSFSKTSKDSQRLSSLEAKLENKSHSQRSIRRIDQFSDDENENENERIQIAKLPTKSKVVTTKDNMIKRNINANNNTNGDDSRNSIDTDHEANNTVRFTDIQSELHNKSHEAVQKKDLLNIVDKSQEVKTTGKLADILEKPIKQKENSTSSLVEHEITPVTQMNTKKRTASETVKELLKSPEHSTNKKSKIETTTQQVKKDTIENRKSNENKPVTNKLLKVSDSASKINKQQIPTKGPVEKTTAPVASKKEVSSPSKTDKIDNLKKTENQDGVDTYEQFVLKSNAKPVPIKINPYKNVEVQRSTVDESEYYTTSDDSYNNDDKQIDKKTSTDRKLEINDITSLQNKILNKDAKVKASNVVDETKAISKTTNKEISDTSSSNSNSSDDSSEDERKATVWKPRRVKKDVSPELVQKAKCTEVLIKSKPAPVITKKPRSKQKIYQTPEFVSSSEEETTGEENNPSSGTIKVNKANDTKALLRSATQKQSPDVTTATSDSKAKQEIKSTNIPKTNQSAESKMTNITTKKDPKSIPENKQSLSTKKQDDKVSPLKKQEISHVKSNKKENESFIVKIDSEKARVSTSKSHIKDTNTNKLEAVAIKTNTEDMVKETLSKSNNSNKKITAISSVSKEIDLKDSQKKTKELMSHKPSTKKSKVTMPSNVKGNTINKFEDKSINSKSEDALDKSIGQQDEVKAGYKSSQIVATLFNTTSKSSTSSKSESDSSSTSETDSNSSDSSSDSESSSEDSSSEDESPSTRTSRRIIVAPPKGSISDSKPHDLSNNTNIKSKGVTGIESVPQSTQQSQRSVFKTTKQPSITKPPLTATSKISTIPHPSQVSETTISNISSQPPKPGVNSSSTASATTVTTTDSSTNNNINVSPLSKLPRKYRPSLSSLSDLVSRGIPDVKEKTSKNNMPSLVKKGKNIRKDNSSSSSESLSSESEDSSSDGDSSSSSSSDSTSSDSSSDSSDEETYISAKSANAALKNKKKKKAGDGGFASLIKDSKKYK